MEITESDLLVATSNFCEGVDSSSNGHIYDDGNLKENLVQEGKQSSILEYEGNINCAMDIFAPDYDSHSSKNSEYSASGNQSSTTNFCDMRERMSDYDGPATEKAASCDYMFLENEQPNMDSMSLSSDTSEAGRIIFSPNNPSSHFIPDRVGCISPHFPTSNITFPSAACCSPSTTEWSTFGEDKENTIPRNPYKSRYLPARPPPAIPERKSLQRIDPIARSSPIQLLHSTTSSPTADLLSMDMVDLQNHLSDAASSPIPSRSLAKPAVPPRKTLFSTGSTSSKSQFSDAEVDLISSSLPEGHINHAHNSSDSSPLPLNPVSQAIKGPPVPPRKNAPKIEIRIVAAPTTTGGSVKSCTESFSFSRQTAGTISGSEPSSSWVNFMDSSTDTVNNTSCNILDTKAEATQQNQNGSADQLKFDVEDEDPHWSKRLSPDMRSTVKKKGTGGIGYLSLENDVCDMIGSIDDVGSCHSVEDAVTISLPANDLSPEKPLSQWATFHNEEDDDDDEQNDANVDNMSSCGAISLPSGGINSTGSGYAGSFNDVDVADLEDDFAINPNRLSAEMPNLKGFNRADKGSQNNLVDFSDDRGSVAVSTGSHEDGDEDVETIFDLTAQGDSLKRKRPRGSITVLTNEDNVTDGSIGSSHMVDAPLDSHANVSFHVGPAGLNEFVDKSNSCQAQAKYADMKKTESDKHPSSCSSRAETPATFPIESNDGASQSMCSNPFWSPSMRNAPSTGSQSSSADTPFDVFVFSTSKSSIGQDKSKPATPIRINPVSSPSTPAPLIRIPPPPLSHSRSSSRHRRSSHAVERTRNMSHDSRRRLELDTASDISQSIATLPSSRAETPTIATTSQDIENTMAATASPIGFADNVFEPFPIDAWKDSVSSNPINRDLFTWLNDSQPAECLTEERSVDGQKAKIDSSNDSFPSDQQKATNSISSHRNCNMNANVTEPVSGSDNFTFNLNTTPNSECRETRGKHLMSPTSLVCDTLTKMNDTLSTENCNFKAGKNTPILPEIDLVQSRSSWDVFMRFPMAKRTMSNRKWVPIHIKLFNDPVDHPHVKLYYTAKSTQPFHALSMASHQMQISTPVLQSHFSEDGQLLGKLHALKLNIVQYKEKQTFTRRRSLAKNASGFKHACKGKQTIKLGFSLHHDVLSFVKAARDAMFYAHKILPKSNNDEHVPTVKYHSRNEILIDVVDEVQAMVNESGVLKACKLRVHFFVGSFLSGDPMVKININDRKVEGKEVVARKDIIPSSLDGWIEVCDPELHESCTSNSLEGDNVGTCICYPPDACRFELMRFKTNYTESELPLKVKSNVTVKCAKLQLRCNVMLNDNIKDGFGQLVCEDIMIRFPIPDDWCTYFKVMGKLKKHSVQAKRSAKSNIKTPTMSGVAMEASIGSAKYEKAYQAIVWRIPRLPDKGAVLKPHVFSCRIELVSDRDLNKLRKLDDSCKPEDKQCITELDDKFKFCEVEYSMIGPTASKVTVRSVSMPNTVGGERFISYRSEYFYKVGISITVERISDDDEVDPADLCLTQ